MTVSLEETIKRVKNKYRAAHPSSDPFYSGNNLEILGIVTGALVYNLELQQENFVDYVMPDTAPLEIQKRWLSIYGGSIPKATKGVFSLAVTGEDGVTLPRGTVFKRSDGARYITTQSVVLPNTAYITPEYSGASFNLNVEQSLTIETVVVDIDDDALVSGIISEGEDELDGASLQRYILKNNPFNFRLGNAEDYEFWSKQVSGVKEAWCDNSSGDIKVFILPESGFTFDTLKPLLEEHVNNGRTNPAGRFADFRQAVSQLISIKIDCKASSQRDAILQAVNNFISNNARLGQSFYSNEFMSVISPIYPITQTDKLTYDASSSAHLIDSAVIIYE